MEFEKHRNDTEKGDLDKKTNNPNDGMNAQWLLLGENLYHLGDLQWQFDSNCEDEGENDVEEEEHEEFSVAKSHAVGDPRAVVIHV